MSAENDLKNEIKENENYIATLVAKNNQQADRLRYMEEFAGTQSAIIEGLKKKVVKYTKLYGDSVAKVEGLNAENRKSMDEVWKLRGETDLLRQINADLERQRNDDDKRQRSGDNERQGSGDNKRDMSESSKRHVSGDNKRQISDDNKRQISDDNKRQISGDILQQEFEFLKRENDELKNEIKKLVLGDSGSSGESTNSSAALVAEIKLLKDELAVLKANLDAQMSQNSHKNAEASFVSAGLPQDDTHVLLASAPNPERILSDKFRALKSSNNLRHKVYTHDTENGDFDDDSRSPVNEKLSENRVRSPATEIEELEHVLQKYKSRFDEEDARKKKVEEVFTLFDLVKKRLSSELLHLEQDQKENSDQNYQKENNNSQTYHGLDNNNNQKYHGLDNNSDQKYHSLDNSDQKYHSLENNNQKYHSLENNNQKYQCLESKIELISRNLENLMNQRSRSVNIAREKSKNSPGRRQKTANLPKVSSLPVLNLDDVSLDESQIDILHRNVGETTQRKYSLNKIQANNIDTRIVSRNSSNGSSRTLKTSSSGDLLTHKNGSRIPSSTPPASRKPRKESVDLGADVNSTKLGEKSDANLDTLERILRENNGSEVDVDAIVAKYS